MTDLWKFSETPITGGSSLEESSLIDGSLEEQITGGMSVSDFFCQKRPETDSKQFTFFADLTVPFGLVYLPPCNESSGYAEEDSDESPKSCESYDKLFSLSSTTLGKKETNRRTRKKITA